MNIINNWVIDSVNVALSLNGLEKVVVTVNYKITATSEDGFYAEFISTKGFAAPHESAFIPYEQVTEEEMIGWVKDEEQDNEILALLEQDINNKRNPPVLYNYELPWAVVEEPIVENDELI
jgi:hypothetical protein